MSAITDKDRIDWLADVNNLIGEIKLPTKCVLNNITSLRDAIDEAMGIDQATNDGQQLTQP